jgi:hypothetical protein
MRISLLFILQIIFVLSASAQTTYTVNNPTDTSVTTNGAGSGLFGDLRYCVSQAVGGSDIIQFNLLSPYTITLNADLVLNNVTLNGSSQLSSAGTPRVSISGNYGIIGQFSSALYINSLCLINNPGKAAITLNSVDGVYINGCYIGTDITGLNYSSTLPPDTAIYSSPGSSNVFIGTYSPNVILTPSGIVFNNTSSSSIYYNMIGLNRKGMNPGGIKRNMKGIELISGSSNDIEYNRIGNCQTAAFISDQNSSSNNLAYNGIGKDQSSAAAPNGVGMLVMGFGNQLYYDTISNSKSILGSSGAGIEISGSLATSNNISGTSFSCNQGGGIQYTNGSVAYQAPTFDSTAFFVYPDGTVKISGTGNPYDYIQFYVTDSCSFGTQGTYVGSTYVYAPATTWSLFAPLYYKGKAITPGLKITAIAVNGASSTFINNTVDLVAFPCSSIKSYAGKDTSMCGGTLYLNGQLTNASQGYWSTSGKGYISYSQYSLSGSPSSYDVSSDINAGAAPLEIYLSANEGGCPIVTDTLKLTLPVPVAVVFGGNATSACPNFAGIPLDLKVYNPTSGGTWTTSGSGSFSPSNTSLNASYIPSITDTLNYPVSNSINITFTPVQATGGCTPVNGSVNIDLNNTNPVSNGTSTLSQCSNSPAIYLPTHGGSSITEIWTKSNGQAIKDSIDPYGYYHYFVPIASDVSGRFVNLIDKVSIPGCVSTYDTLAITYVTAPVVFAGDSSAICGSATSFALSKAKVNVQGVTVQWTGFVNGGLGNFLQKQQLLATNGGGDYINKFSGTFASDTTVNTIYLPSPSDRSSGLVFLTLTATTSDKVCAVSNYFPLTFAPVPNVVSAGADARICQGDTLQLSGNVTSGFPHKWTSPGTGKFLPSSDSLHAAYIPSQTDYKKIAFNLMLTGGNSNCPVKDELLLILLPKPDVGVGTKQVICPETSANLIGAIDVDQVGIWTIKKNSTGQIADSSKNNIQVVNITAPSNTYVWTLTDTTTGCKNSAEYSVNYCSSPPLKVYNALSPNNDGVGECLEIENIDFYKDNKVSVFNQWGDMVFKVDNYKNLEKDGNNLEKIDTGNAFTGKSNIGTIQELPNGSYYYLIDKGTLGGKSEKGYLVIQK